jgi:hypothetical protein
VPSDPICGDVSIDGAILFFLLDLIPDFGKPTIVAATEVLPRYNALTVESRERLVEAVAVRRCLPTSALSI